MLMSWLDVNQHRLVMHSAQSNARIHGLRRIYRRRHPAIAGFVPFAQGTLMIGPKKLKAIREELAAVLAANGRDPIQSLDDLIKASHSRTGKPASKEVLQSLRRFMEGPAKLRVLAEAVEQKSQADVRDVAGGSPSVAVEGVEKR